MSSRSVLVALLAAAIAGLPSGAAAQDSGGVKVGGAKRTPGGLERALSTGEDEANDPDPDPGASFVRSDGTIWVGIPALGSMEGDEGETRYCRRTRWVRVDPADRQEFVRTAEQGYLALFGGLPELEGHNPFLECPIEPSESIPPVVLREAITRTIRDDMPRPTLEVPPGYALTGMEAYLVTNHQLEYGPVTHTVDLGVAVLDVTVTATGMTEVDWGDGTVATYDVPGTPWPEGSVTHTYRDTGTVSISVTDTWQVTYRVPALGIEDTVTAPLPASTLDEFEVQQVQAVRIDDRRVDDRRIDDRRGDVRREPRETGRAPPADSAALRRS
jgi:hypothetical protein